MIQGNIRVTILSSKKQSKAFLYYDPKYIYIKGTREVVTC